MAYRGAVGASVVAGALLVSVGASQAFDETKYPDLKGQWRRGSNAAPPSVAPGRLNTFDPTKEWGPAQQAPLTPEYQARFEANLADQAAGGQGIGVTYTCASPGMPRVINGYGPTEFVVTPGATHILVDNIHDSRRIFTDGRDWPKEIMPSLIGYSIGRWIDTDGDGKYDMLEAETRGFRGPRAYDATGIPLHRDNQTVIKERFYIDGGDRNIAHDEVTVIDHALTHPWTVVKNYRRDPSLYAVWNEENCPETNNHVRVGTEDYMISADGLLMPAHQGQKAPDLRYFK
jgi:hypothetical protein